MDCELYCCYGYQLCLFCSGHLIIGDSFKTSMFKQTFQKVFSKDEQGDYLMAFNASVEVKV